MPTRKQVDQRAATTMRAWLALADRGAAKYAAIEEPYIDLLDVLDNVTNSLKDKIAGREEDGRGAFLFFLKRAFRAVRYGCRGLENADTARDLAEAVDFVDECVTADEDAVQWLRGLDDVGEMMWNNQFAGKTYASCLEIARFAGPLYARGYHTDRAFIEHGPAMPRYGPKRADKLHLSFEPSSFARVRDKVLPFLARAGYTHKMVADAADLKDRQMGKVVTIYPKIVKDGDRWKADSTDLDSMADLLTRWLPTLGLIPGTSIAGETPVNGSWFVFLEKDAQLRG